MTKKSENDTAKQHCRKARKNLYNLNSLAKLAAKEKIIAHHLILEARGIYDHIFTHLTEARRHYAGTVSELKYDQLVESFLENNKLNQLLGRIKRHNSEQAVPSCLLEPEPLIQPAQMLINPYAPAIDPNWLIIPAAEITTEMRKGHWEEFSLSYNEFGLILKAMVCFEDDTHVIKLKRLNNIEKLYNMISRKHYAWVYRNQETGEVRIMIGERGYVDRRNNLMCMEGRKIKFTYNKAQNRWLRYDSRTTLFRCHNVDEYIRSGIGSINIKHMRA